MRKMKKLKPEDTYSFPYWNEEYRVKGQPHQMAEKYEATYEVVARVMACQSLLLQEEQPYQQINAMGLLATNFKTIPDYLVKRLKSLGVRSKIGKNTIVVERNQKVVEKIDKLFDSLHKQRQLVGDLWLIGTPLESITKALAPTKRRPVSERDHIRSCYMECRSTINFFDFDLMCNWSIIDVETQIAPIVREFSADRAVVHINGIQHLSRTRHYSTTEEEIQEIIDFLVQELEEEFAIGLMSPINSYTTKNKVTTTMSSVVLEISRR